MTSEIPEVVAAAKWWADAMSAPLLQDNGDGFQSAFASRGRSLVDKLNADERGRFETALQAEIAAHVLRADWERAKSEPNWASSCRVIGVDYGPDQVLQRAADVLASPDDRKTQARISLLWPIKTHMWIDPGCVKVKHGYRAKAQVIYGCERDDR